MTVPKLPRLSSEDAGAILVDAANGAFDDQCQQMIWAVAKRLKSLPSVLETVPGMNNLMVVFDPLLADPEAVEAEILSAWQASSSGDVMGPLREVEVQFGGDDSDLAELAAAKSMSPETLVSLFTAPVYSVAAVGAMPGFVYLSGLDPALATPRNPRPRSAVPAGAVIIGAAQAGIMPITAPSGWHILGQTSLSLFDPRRTRPALFAAGDRIRFVPGERSHD